MINHWISASSARPRLFYFFNATSEKLIHLNRTYVTRAHPVPTPLIEVPIALETLLQDMEARKLKRNRRFKNMAKWKKIPFVEPKHPNEMIELALNLNLDPRKPGQALRGSIVLPNGSGKTVACVVFTEDEELKEEALRVGALHAGGDTLIDQILSGEIAVDSFQRTLATREVMPTLTKKAARLLGPRGLMPNAKLGTILPEAKQARVPMLRMLETVLAGKEVTYRTEKAGVVHVPVGRCSFGSKKLLENIGQVMKSIFEAQPETFGKTQKKGTKAMGRGTKYLLRASVSSTQGPGIRLDLRTVDPSSPFFLTEIASKSKLSDLPETSSNSSEVLLSSEG